MSEVRIVLCAALFGLCMASCSKKEAAGSGAPASGNPEAQEIYRIRCMTCHGADGTGNGPAAAALNPKPRNYAEATWQQAITDDEIKNIIIVGGAAVGKSPGMPSNPDLRGKPEVVNGLLEIIRSFGKK